MPTIRQCVDISILQHVASDTNTYELFLLDDAMHAILLLCTLPESWENLIVLHSASCKEDNLSLQVVKTSILNEETRRKDKSALSELEVNVTQNFGKEEVNIGVLKIEASLMQDQNLEEDTMFLLWEPDHFQRNS